MTYQISYFSPQGHARELALSITLDEKPRDTASESAPSNGQMPQEGNYEDWYNYFAPFFGDKG